MGAAHLRTTRAHRCLRCGDFVLGEPLEVHKLFKGVTVTRGGAFVINVAAVIYLLVSKRLFGLRGGRKAYDAERRGEQLLDVERAATTED